MFSNISEEYPAQHAAEVPIPSDEEANIGTHFQSEFPDLAAEYEPDIEYIRSILLERM